MSLPAQAQTTRHIYNRSADYWAVTGPGFFAHVKPYETRKVVYVREGFKGAKDQPIEIRQAFAKGGGGPRGGYSDSFKVGKVGDTSYIQHDDGKGIKTKGYVNRKEGPVLNTPASGDVILLERRETLPANCILVYTGANGTGDALRICGSKEKDGVYQNSGRPNEKVSHHYNVSSFYSGSNVFVVEFIDGNSKDQNVRLKMNAAPGKVVNLPRGINNKATGVAITLKD